MMSPLSKVLHRTHKTFVEGCKELDLDPSIIDPSTLDVMQCDNCGLWDKPYTMITTHDESVLCKYCSHEYL